MATLDPDHTGYFTTSMGSFNCCVYANFYDEKFQSNHHIRHWKEPVSYPLSLILLCTVLLFQGAFVFLRTIRNKNHSTGSPFLGPSFPHFTFLHISPPALLVGMSFPAEVSLPWNDAVLRSCITVCRIHHFNHFWKDIAFYYATFHQIFPSLWTFLHIPFPLPTVEEGIGKFSCKWKHYPNSLTFTIMWSWTRARKKGWLVKFCMNAQV